MPRRNLLSSEQRIRLFAIPIDPAEMARHYVLTSDDLAVIRTKRRPINRLGFAIQLCLFRYPGQGMGPGEHLPPEMIAFTAQQLGMSSGKFGDYALRDQTRREHAVELQKYSATSELRVRRLAVLPEGGCGCRLGHRSRRADRPGNGRSFAVEQRAASHGGGVGTDRTGGAGARPEEGLRDPGGRSDRRRAGRTREASGDRSRTAPLSLCLAAGLFGVARPLQHRRATRPPRIRARPGHRSRTRRSESMPTASIAWSTKGRS